ncbi:MAG: T9SS type B sorting domain-containing protein [Aureibaculum sp.]
MKIKKTSQKFFLGYIIYLISLSFFLFPILSNAQNTVPFEKRHETLGVYGDLTIIGNANLGPTIDTPYNGTDMNDNITMTYVDIDNDNSTFNSSSARFTTGACNRVIYAGLYWGSVFAPSNLAPNQVKFKIPGGNYQDLVADANIDKIYYKDVTSIVGSNLHPDGDYFVANIVTTVGRGQSAGWSLVLIYEDPAESRKYISTFDGLSAVTSLPYNVVDFNYSGFVTPPTGPVRGKIGVASMEGDLGLVGDQMLFKADGNATFTALYDAENPVNNFFNSKITKNGAQVLDRNLNSTNTLGWDIKLLNLTDLNPGNSLIGNNESGATVRVTNNIGGDHIYTYLNTFSIEIIEPVLNVVTSVEDNSGNEILYQSPVPLGATVWYNLNFQNVGTDSAQNTYILNILPINVTLNESSIELPAGVTYTYNPAARELRFDIDDSLVQEGNLATSYDIRYQVTASTDCFDYTDACTNILVNSVSSYYDGETSGQNVSGYPGLIGIDDCGFGTVNTMDLFVDTSSCSLDSNEYFCNDTLTISGHDGYDTYEWVDSGGNVVGNTQSIDVTGPGIYTATQTRTGCTQTTRVITVFGLDVDASYTDVQCFNASDGKISVSVNDASTNYTYELFQGASLVASEGPTSAQSYEFSGLDIGDYDLKVTNVDGCYYTESFTIQEPTVLRASGIVKDHIMPCNGGVLAGRIEVDQKGGTPGYEYSIDNGTTYQAENVFEVFTAGTYTLSVRDAQGCVATSMAIVNLENEIEYNIIKDDVVCLGDTDGSITVNISNNSAGNTLTYSIDGGTSFQSVPTFNGLAKGDYEIIIRKIKGANTCEIIEPITIDQLVYLELTASAGFSCEGSFARVIASVDPIYSDEVMYTLDGTITQASGVFENVPDGEHTITVEHMPTGCTDEPVTVTVEAYQPITFELIESGLNEYTIMAIGGKPQYEYAMNDENDLSSTNVFNILSSGNYTFYVQDTKGCVVQQTLYIEFLELEIPNFFTPDGDGNNDTWYPRNITFYPNISVAIFDRYQRLIVNYQGNQFAWDGTYKNKLLPSGDYWYIVKINDKNDNREFKGNFTLYR